MLTLVKKRAIVLLSDNHMMLRRNVPLATQVMHNIMVGIESGNLLQSENQLFTEEELCRVFNVSRSTIREALTGLEQKGMIYKKQGLGTFIKHPQIHLETGLEILESIETIANRLRIPTRMGELTVVQRNTEPQEAKALGVALNTPVLDIRRLIFTEDQPIAYLIDILPSDKISLEDLSYGFHGSILDILIKQNNGIADRSVCTISVEDFIDESVYLKLNKKASDHFIIIDSIIYSIDAKAVELTTSYLDPFYFKFSMNRKVAPLSAMTQEINIGEGTHG